MKNIKIFAVLLFVMGLIAASCEGPEGPRGPAGAAGTDGTDGNANVTVFCYGDTTITSAASLVRYYLNGASTGLMDSSMVIPYYGTGSVWYMAGGLGAGGGYYTRFYIWPGSVPPVVSFEVLNPDATAYTGSDIYWDSVRIFVIPANNFRMAQKNGVDFNDIHEVNSYFGQK